MTIRISNCLEKRYDMVQHVGGQLSNNFVAVIDIDRYKIYNLFFNETFKATRSKIFFNRAQLASAKIEQYMEYMYVMYLDKQHSNYGTVYQFKTDSEIYSQYIHSMDQAERFRLVTNAAHKLFGWDTELRLSMKC